MRHTIAALRSGSDPVGPLPAGSFHRTLEEPIYCPKCEATYFLIADYDWAISRHFEEESRRHIALLKKTVFRGHAAGHRIAHFESNGVVVTHYTQPEQPKPLESLEPVSRLIH